MHQEAENIIRHLDLQPHPEGGYFRETYRSEGIIKEIQLGKQYTGDRNYSTSIYFLLTSENFSAFHRIKQDEIWHFYKGSSLNIHMINAKGEYSKVVLGVNLDQEEVPQFIVPANCWFAANVIESDSYSLFGCTVAPGFDFSDFELANRDVLIKRYPTLSNVITKFSR